jgi:hypothetical protein
VGGGWLAVGLAHLGLRRVSGSGLVAVWRDAGRRAGGLGTGRPLRGLLGLGVRGDLARDAVGPPAGRSDLRAGVVRATAVRGSGRLPVGNKDEAESLILAQNERWRRA